MNTTLTNTKTISINRTLVNVYKLLSANMLTSAFCAYFAISLNIGHTTALFMSLAALGLMFVIGKKANSATGVYLTFLFTALLGASIGPQINYYLSIPNGGSTIFQALLATSITFGTLSLLAIMRPDINFSRMKTFLTVGLIIAVVAMIANIFMQIPILSLIISGAVAIIMAGFILYDTENILKNEPNYVLATVSMYLNIFNLFSALLNILGATSSD